MTPKKPIHFIRVPQLFLESPEFRDLMRCLSISEEQAIGRLVLFLKYLYRRRLKKFSVKRIDKIFGPNWCAALEVAKLGKIINQFFYLKLPESLINKPPNAAGGNAVKTRPRDKFGQYLPSSSTVHRNIIYRGDGEGNLIETMGIYNAKNKYRGQLIQRQSMVLLNSKSRLSIQGLGASGSSVGVSPKQLD